MSRRDRDNSRQHHEQRGRSNERSSSHYSSSRNDSRSQFARPRHQQTSQSWQNGNYHQSANYNSNYQYQNRPRSNRPSSSSYNHNTPWNQQWGGYNPPYQSSQWGLSNQQHVSSQNFTPHNQLSSYSTHQTQPQESGLSQKPRLIENSKIPTPSTTQNPPLGSREYREKALEESKDRLKKSLREALDRSPSNVERHDDNSVDQLSVVTPDSGRSGPRPRTALVKTVRDSDKVGVCISSSSPSQKQIRRSSSDSNSHTSSESVNPPKSSTLVNRRSRSTSLSSSTNSANNSGTCTASKQVLQSTVASKGQTSKEVHAAKQRVIKELLSMNRVKLKELVSYPRSRKIDMVMKYMIKESRAQQSHKQRQLAQAGMVGTLSESSNTLAQQDVEALLSDPDLHISLSNLPTEVIETLGSIFKLNSLGDVESEDQGEVLSEITEDLSNSGMNELCNNDVLPDLDSSDVDQNLGGSMKVQLKMDEMCQDVKPGVDLGLCTLNVESPNLCNPTGTLKFTPADKLTDVGPSLDSVEASCRHDIEPQTNCSEVSMTIASHSEDIVKRSDPIKKIPITRDLSSLELTVDVDIPELLERLSPLSAGSTVISTSQSELVDNLLVDPLQKNRCSLTPESMKNNVITTDHVDEMSQSQQAAYTMSKEMDATPNFSHQFSMTLENLEVPEDSIVACTSQKNLHRPIAYDNSQRLGIHSSLGTVKTVSPNPFIETCSSSKSLETTSVDLLSAEKINMTPEYNVDFDKSVTKHLESSIPSSIETNPSETYVPLSESKAKITETIFEESNSTGTGTLELVNICSEQNNITTDPVEKVGMAAKKLEHDQIIKSPLDLPVPEVSGRPIDELSDVKAQESVLKDEDELTVLTYSNDVSALVGLQPGGLEKITDDCNLSTPFISFDTTDCVENGLAQDIVMTSQKEIESPKFTEQTPDHQTIKSVSPEPIIIDQHWSSNAGKVNEQSTFKTVEMETEKTVVREMGHKPMDPMCILYESIDAIGSRHVGSQEPFDTIIPRSTGECEQDKVSILDMATACDRSVSDPESTDSDHINAAKVGSFNSHKCGILTETESIQVKSEQEEIDIPTLYDHTPHLHHRLSETLPLPSTEVSTQTENSFTTATNLTDMLQLFKTTCENPSQEAAFNQLKELFMQKTDSCGDSEPPTRCTQTRSIQQKNGTNSKGHGPTKKLHRPTTVSTSAQYSASQFGGFSLPNNLSDPILLDAAVSEVNQESLGLHMTTSIVTTSDLEKMGPQERLKSLFHNITLIENKIETWMEIKKKLYEKVNNILEDEKSQCSSSSEQKDTSMIEVMSSSKEQVAISVSTPTSKLRKPRGVKDVSPITRKKVGVSKTTTLLTPRPTSPSEHRRVIKKTAASLVKTTCIDENMESCCVTQSKVKKEIHSGSTDESSLISKSKSRRKRSFGQKKRKVINSRVPLSTTVGSDKSLTTISPPLKRSFRNKPNLGEKIDIELLTTTKSEESDVRCSRRKIDKAPQLPILSNKSDESLIRTSRRRIEKEVPEVLNIAEHDSARTNRRTRRCQANDANEEAVELCILSPNLSRRTKGERKEILAPTELQNIHSMADQGPSPRRATRQSISEPLIQELVFTEVKKIPKRKACEMENADEPQSLPLLNTMRKCSVVLEPLALHLNKKAKYSSLQDQSSGGLEEDTELSEFEYRNKSVMAEPNLGADITSDEDDMPLFKIKQCINPNITAGSSVTKFLNEADHNSVSSSDTALDQGIDDLEVDGITHHKYKKTKKKTRKEKQYDHHSRNENLDFVDHNRGTILDIKIVGRHLLAASEDGFLYSYSMKSGKLKKKYEGHQAAVTCLCTIDGEKESERSCPEKVVTGSLDDHVRCFLFKSAELIHAPLKIGTALCVDYNWGIVYLGTKLGEVAKVNAKTFSLIGDHMKFSSESILAIKATKEGPRKVLIIGTRDQPIAIRDADSGLFLRTVSGVWHHTVCSLLLDKSLVYCGTMSGPIPVFDFTNGQEVFRLQAGVGVRCVKIYNNLLFAGCYDGNIYIYNVKDQSLVQTISGSGKMVLCLDVTKNKVIYSCKDALKAMNFPPEVSRALKDAKLK